MEEEPQTSLERSQEEQKDDQHQQTFEKAFKANDHEKVRDLLEENGDHIDVDRVWDTSNGMTILMHTCLRNWTDMAYVIGSRANWNATGCGGFTALHIVSLNGNLRLAQFAIEQGADINALDHLNCSALRCAVISENGDLVSYFLKHDDFDKSLVNLAETSRSQTCLYVAARNGSDDIVADLIEHGADVNQQTDIETTPIWIASQLGRLSNVLLLLERGADPKIPDEIGRTPLHMACMGGHLETIQVLVAMGCDPLRKTTDSHRWNGLHFAAHTGHKHVLGYAVEQLKVDLASLSEGETPLHRACLFGHEDCVRYLVKHGMQHTSVNEMGETPLQIAESEGHSYIVDFLRSIQDKTLSVNELDSNGFSPLNDEKKSKINQYVLRENRDVKPIRKILEHIEKEFHAACDKQFASDDCRMPDDDTVEMCVSPFREPIESTLGELVDRFETVVEKCTRDNQASRLLEEYETSSSEFAKFRSSKAIYRDAGRNAKNQHGKEVWDDYVDYLESSQMKRPYEDEKKTEIVQPHRDDIATLIGWGVWTQMKLNRWNEETSRQGTATSHAGRVKSVCRVAEKMGMYVGKRDRMDPSIVCDYVRAMKTFANLQLLAMFLEKMQSRPEIYVFKIKNRFYKDVDSADNPWQDVMVHFVFTDVPMEHRVICELQLTLDNILFTRKSMAGHGAYARFRNSFELRKAVSSRRNGAYSPKNF